MIKDIANSIQRYCSLFFRILNVKAVYGHWTLNSLARHPAFVVFPYSVMSYKMTELYSLGVPIFVPSPKCFLEYGGIGRDRTSTTCVQHLKNESNFIFDHYFAENSFQPTLLPHQAVQAERPRTRLSLLPPPLLPQHRVQRE